MSDRRKFIKLTALTAGGLALSRCTLSENEREGSAAASSKGATASSKPFVISTWKHGMAANAGAWEVLSAGGDALDAVERGVRVTEADLTNRSVGLGGRPDRDGRVTLDASVMDHDSRCGSVAFLQHIKHPVSVARAVMEQTPHVMLAGEGAYRFALKRGFERVDFEVPLPEVRAAYEQWLDKGEYRPEANIENHDTIGMLAIDSRGRIGGACTTSGMAYKMHGRIGDSPVIGSGLFIDGEVGGATATGLGEAIMRVSGSSAVVELMRAGATPGEACKAIVERILRKHPEAEGLQVGFIAVDTEGRYGGYSVLNGFNYAFTAEGRNELVESGYHSNRE